MIWIILVPYYISARSQFLEQNMALSNYNKAWHYQSSRVDEHDANLET